MNKILSIVIPTYNMEKYLDKCLSSLIVEDPDLLNSLEAIVVIDGSKDRSSEIAHSYQDRFPDSFVVIDKENGNYGSCVNRGLKEATGKYIKVLDADDYYETSALSEYLRLLSNCNSDLVVTDYSIVDANYKKIKTVSYPFPNGLETKVDIYTDTPEFYKELSMHAITYRRSIVVDMGYKQTEGVSYTDQEWIFMPMTHMESMHYFPIDLYQYLIGREGQTVDVKVQAKQGKVTQELIIKRVQFYEKEKNNLSERKVLFLKNHLMSEIMWFYHAGIVNGLFYDEDIDCFDNNLMNISHYLYDMSEQSPIAKVAFINYVRGWRNKTFIVPFIRLIWKIKSRVR